MTSTSSISIDFHFPYGLREQVDTKTSSFKVVLLLIALLFAVLTSSFSQDLNIDAIQQNDLAIKINGDSLNKLYKQRKIILSGATVAGYGSLLYFLNQAWYKGYARSSFHTINDNNEWLQMDKIGHAWSTYNINRGIATTWQWAGMSRKKAVIIGSLSSLGYLTIIEYLDGRSAEWGWSWGDMTANTFGTSLFAVQSLLWNKQIVQLKYSAHLKNYGELKGRADELYGSSLPARLLKDYNAQSYWLSFNLNNLMPKTNLPKWLNGSIGYSGEGMFGGRENIEYDKNGNVIFNRTDITRYRQWFFSADIDFTQIKTHKKYLKTLFFVLNSIKIPAPSLELSRGKIRGHWLYF